LPKFSAVVVSLLVAHAGIDDPDDPAAVDAFWAVEVSVVPVVPLPSVVDEVAVGEGAADEDGAVVDEVAEADADDALSDPHAVSASPAVTSIAAGITRRAVLVSMIVPLSYGVPFVRASE